MITSAEKHHAKCPWCPEPVKDHEEREGFMFRIYVCPSAPEGWVGVFVEEPVDR